MPQYLIPLIGDAGPNDGTAIPAGPHYLNVRENPHDGDTTRIREVQTNIEAFSCDWSVIPDNEPILSVVLRWTAQPVQNDGDTVFQAGFRVGGTSFYAAPRDLGFGTVYVTFDETFAVDPLTGLPIIKDRLIAFWEAIIQCTVATLEVGFPRLTQCVPLVNTLAPPTRPTGSDSAIVPSATGSAMDPSAAASAIAPGSRMQKLSPGSGISVIEPTATMTVLGPSGSPIAVHPGSSVAGSRPQAVPTPIAPSSRMAAVRPSGIPSVIVPGSKER